MLKSQSDVTRRAWSDTCHKESYEYMKKVNDSKSNTSAIISFVTICNPVGLMIERTETCNQFNIRRDLSFF